MSVLSSRQIQDLIHDPEIKLIEPHSDQLSDPRLKAAWEKGLARVEGVNFELSLNRVLVKDIITEEDEGYVGVDERRTPRFIEKSPVKGEWRLRPGFYELQTFETINQPLFLASRLVEKRTIITFGAGLLLADVAPGYSGRLGIGLIVFPGCVLPIERGALFMSISFQTIDDVMGVTAWDGIWKENKMFTEQAERPR